MDRMRRKFAGSGGATELTKLTATRELTYVLDFKSLPMGRNKDAKSHKA